MNPKYAHIGAVDDRVIEEGIEVIDAINKTIKIMMKSRRFGLDSAHPDTPGKPNVVEILEEIADLKRVLEPYEVLLVKERDRLFGISSPTS